MKLSSGVAEWTRFRRGVIPRCSASGKLIIWLHITRCMYFYFACWESKTQLLVWETRYIVSRRNSASFVYLTKFRNPLSFGFDPLAECWPSKRWSAGKWEVMIMWMLSVRADGQKVIKKAFEQVWIERKERCSSSLWVLNISGAIANFISCDYNQMVRSSLSVLRCKFSLL